MNWLSHLTEQQQSSALMLSGLVFSILTYVAFDCIGFQIRARKQKATLYRSLAEGVELERTPLSASSNGDRTNTAGRRNADAGRPDPK